MDEKPVMQCRIEGASDDLIEIHAITKGAPHEEFAHSGDHKALLALSDGSLIELCYDEDGIWRIKVLATGACELALTPGDVEQDRNDTLLVTGPLRWIVKAERSDYNPLIVKARA